MAAIAKIDSIKTLSARERNGIIVSMRRLAIVVGLVDVDYTVLFNALEQAGIPLKGTTPDGDGFRHLFLVERNPDLYNEDPGTAKVELVYETAHGGSNQDVLVGDVENVIRGKMTASVQQVTTNFYYPNGDKSNPKTQIVVGHIYPDTTKEEKQDERRNKYFSQGGEITVHQPQKNFKFSGYMDTNFPSLFANELIASVNKIEWMTDGPREWMCMMVAWDRIGYNTRTTTNRYRFDFEFQHNPDTWDPTAVFIDDRTGRPPPKLKKEEELDPVDVLAGRHGGVRLVPYQRQIDLVAKFQGVGFEEQ